MFSHSSGCQQRLYVLCDHFIMWSIIFKTYQLPLLTPTSPRWAECANELTLCFPEGLWSWTERCWRWWMIKLSPTLKESAFLQLNVCSFLRSLWPSSLWQTLELQPVADLNSLNTPIHMDAAAVHKPPPLQNSASKHWAAPHWTEMTWTCDLYGFGAIYSFL